MLFYKLVVFKFIIYSVKANAIELKAVKACSSNHDFDYILLAIQWAPSFCNNTLCNINSNSWGIHGAWPQFNNGSWPQYCCFESEFDLNKIANLVPELIRKWPTLKAGGTHESFWEHEWTKHGTCSMQSPLLSGHFNYFSYTLHLFDLFPVQQWLSSAQIYPSSSTAYSRSLIHESVRKGLGKRVELECLPKNPYPLLQHIYVCLDKITLDPFDCPRDDDPQCGTGSILLPAAN